MTIKSIDNWLDKKNQTQDTISELLCNRLSATFCKPTLKKYDELPPLWHWAFFQEPAHQNALGPDGHPNSNTFIPGINGFVRMWAGGRVKFLEPLKVGLEAVRESTITRVTEKEGSTGKLIFVTVHHEIIQQGTLCISEEQDIVYRPPAPVTKKSEPFAEEFDWIETVEPTPTLLFRYSAVTFNAHRIHYDWPYTTGEESYADLVVHGPLIATLMVKAFTDANPKLKPVLLSYRGLKPLTAEEEFRVSGKHDEDGAAVLWAFNKHGPAHTAKLQYKETY
ncbi:hypothetical protein GCM10011352_04480 [Marinobacterium zhoushanense]|uniref:FAS1-like dehydratase domain-containing protein n=1 Tax=Marinobacterium zhoushanense TaxID=1679163 RepID=A0ABQ1K393_9GAMM|nr:MaoC family dehydratase N-terminal domain-containing protein [Marinobacterium zhoushanense]GGB81822.1 hypothetical protein GCM10011352_04480 [Marinobacterium zhoushanense]